MGTSSHQTLMGKGANQATGLGHRKRAVGASKKHSAKSLGAVRLKELPPPPSKAALEENDQQENVDPQPSGATAFDPPAKVLEKKSPTTLFQDELARTCTTDKWFDEQLNRNTTKSSGSAGELLCCFAVLRAKQLIPSSCLYPTHSATHSHTHTPLHIPTHHTRKLGNNGQQSQANISSA